MNPLLVHRSLRFSCLVVGLLAGTVTPQAKSFSDTDTQARISAQIQRLPLTFEPNQGQTDPRVKFIARGDSYGLFLTATETVLSLRAQPRDGRDAGTPEHHRPAGGDASRNVVRLRMEGANPDPEIVGLEPLPARSNYFVGSEPQLWRRDVPGYAKVKYTGVYHGIDVVYYGNQRQLEYDFVVAPGADPKPIALRFDGIRDLRVDRQGNLVLATANGNLIHRKPVTYQEIDGERRYVESRYQLRGKRTAGIRVGSYDTTRPLIIDPVLSYSTYLGGTGFDRAWAIAVDAAGNAYVTGHTSSADFPTANALQAANGGDGLGGPNDAFVFKLNAAGSALVFSTYLGGAGFDAGTGIAVDSAGNVYICGYTFATNFPTVNPIQAAKPAGSFDTPFVAKLNAAGNALVYSTYLGGSAGDSARDIAVDSAGNAYVVGATSSLNFPTANALQAASGGGLDAFVAKLNAAGNALIYSTYLGGGGLDIGGGIALDVAGNAYVVGQTSSANFPTVNAIQAAKSGGNDAFITKLNAAGTALVYSTYLGGNADDVGRKIAVDAGGNTYATGETASTDFPTANAIQAAKAADTDAFVTKLNAAGTAFVYSTFLGGNGADVGHDIAVDGAGRAYVTGTTTSTNFPTVNPIQAANGGDEDVFVVNLNAAGNALVYSTYLGGASADIGYGIAVDAGGNAYVTGQALSTNFPVANALQPAKAGNNLTYDAFVTKINPVVVAATSTSVSSSANPAIVTQPVTFTATVTSAAVPVTVGTVTFTEGATTLAASVPLNGAGIATFTTSTLSLGNHTITATYNGPVAFATSSGNVNQQVTQATPTIATTASAGIVIGGGQLTDTATVSGRVAPAAGATIDFRLYGPDDATCAGAPVFQSLGVPYPQAGGPVASTAFVPVTAGTYRWRAFYSGDVNNVAVAGACNDAGETVVVARATPTIATMASPNVFVGGQVTDAITVSGRVNPLAGATVDFRLYGPDDATCSAPPVFQALGVAYPQAGGSVTSPAFVPTSPGTYRWRATYSGDANNAGVTGSCGDANQSVTVIAVSTSIPIPTLGAYAIGFLALMLALLGLFGLREERRGKNRAR